MSDQIPLLSTPPNNIPSDEVLLTSLDPTLSPMTSASQEDLQRILEIPNANNTELNISPIPSPTQNSTLPNSQLPMDTQSPTPTSTSIQSPTPISPSQNDSQDTLKVTISNSPQPTSSKYDMTKDPHYIKCGFQPPVLHPFKSLNKLRELPPNFIELHPNFKPNLISLYLTPTNYKFKLTNNRRDDHYVAYASRQLNQLTFWQSKRIRFFSLQFNFLKPTPFDLSTDTSDPEILSLRSREQHHQTYSTFLKYPHTQNFIYQNHKYTSPFNFHTNYRIDSNLSTGHIRNYDPIKQYYIFSPAKNPTRPLIVPQEYLILSNDSLLPSNIPEQVSIPFQPLEFIVNHPLDDTSRSYYTSLVHKHYNFNQLLFLLAKLIPYILQKQYKYGPEPHLKKLYTTPTIKCNQFDINPTQFTNDILTLLTPYTNRSPDINPLILFKNLLTSFEQTISLLQSSSLALSQLQLSSDTLNNSIKQILSYHISQNTTPIPSTSK